MALTPVEIGAAVSGVLSVLGAGVSVKAVVRYCDRQCEARLKAYRDGEAWERDDPHRHAGSRGEHVP